MEENIKEIYQAALAVREKAYAPYSGFKVGAAVRGGSGKLYVGCNVENASYGLTICAERNAVYAAVSAGETILPELCVTADTEGVVTPCGACRQVLQEFNCERIILSNCQGEYEIIALRELLPRGFAKTSSGKKKGV